MSDKKSVLIPDEYVPDYSIPHEEEEKRRADWNKKSKAAFKEIDSWMGKSEG